jgi:hypothetical protein
MRSVLPLKFPLPLKRIKTQARLAAVLAKGRSQNAYLKSCSPNWQAA